MPVAKKARNDDAGPVLSCIVTEPELLIEHPYMALLEAVHTDNFEEAHRLLELHYALKTSDTPAGLPTMTPPLIHAAWRGNEKLASLFLLQSTEETLTTICDVGFGGCPLHWAAASGKAVVLMKLIAHGGGKECVNARSFEGQTPLHAAAGHGHLQCVSLLMAHKADPDLVDLRQASPLHEAAEWGHKDVAEELLKEATADLRDHDGETPLLKAARAGHTDIVELLVGKGVSLNDQNEAGITPLIFASFFGHLETVRLLHSSGANLKLVDAAKGRNALEWAAFNNHREVVQMLLARQASAYNSVLQLAKEADADDVLELLRSI